MAFAVLATESLDKILIDLNRIKEGIDLKQVDGYRQISKILDYMDLTDMITLKEGGYPIRITANTDFAAAKLEIEILINTVKSYQEKGLSTWPEVLLEQKREIERADRKRRREQRVAILENEAKENLRRERSDEHLRSRY